MPTYKEVIEEFFSRIPAYQKIGSSAIKKDLSNIQFLMDQLDNPHLAYPTIHIAGTNGKGTCSHILASILQTSGLKVGMYTSPHYVDFRERIKINGKLIDEETVVRFINTIDHIGSHFEPSFFEISVAMAFDYFRNEKVDVAVIETGLGGLLDSTNIVQPIATLITNISLDHQHILGNSEYEIAHAKAGIIKRETPVVIGKYQVSCDFVFFDTARRKKAPMTFASLLWSVRNDSQTKKFQRQGDPHSYEIRIDHSSPFMIENIISTLETIYQVNPLLNNTLSRAIIQDGIHHFKKNTTYLGRWQLLQDQPTVIADSAHNATALRKVLQRLKRNPNIKIHFVLGFVQGKDISEFFQHIDLDQSYYFTQPSIFRALTIDRIKDIGMNLKCQKSFHPDVKTAIDVALSVAKKNEMVFITGSSFVVGEAIEYFSSI